MFSPFLLRAAGFLLPFYIKAWAISILRHRRQRQCVTCLNLSCHAHCENQDQDQSYATILLSYYFLEAAALAAAEVAFILLSGQGRGVRNRTPLPHVGNNRRNGAGIGHSCSDRRLLVCPDCARIYGFYQVQDQMTWCLSFSSNQLY
uniref:Uncharacterized protein n=1 Tax=Setaria viridis TaxID=4556 RepID=A0A4U6VW93_SETVI|nr:hypothetical protein SEVIR_2G211650v2 [Setaria viridis]